MIIIDNNNIMTTQYLRARLQRPSCLGDQMTADEIEVMTTTGPPTQMTTRNHQYYLRPMK